MSGDELAYYRAIEDHFARLRGTAFLFTPKDFALLRRWWAEGVPLAAVMAGIGEAMEKRRERGDDPVSSLAYCRHAVARHAKRLAAAAVGGTEDPSRPDVPALLRGYEAAVASAAARLAEWPGVAAALGTLAAAVGSLPVDAPVAALEATVASLEASALEAAAAGLPAERRREVDEAVRLADAAAAEGSELSPVALRAIRLRAWRAVLGLPRPELTGDAP